MGIKDERFIPTDYLLLWQVKKRIPQTGFINALTGKTIKKVKTFVQRFDSKTVAEYGFHSIKRDGYKPLLLKIIKE